MQRPCDSTRGSTEHLKGGPGMQLGPTSHSGEGWLWRGVGRLEKCWGLPAAWQPSPHPPGILLTFMGMGGPQLHHGQVAGGGGAEGEVRGQGHWAPVG